MPLEDVSTGVTACWRAMMPSMVARVIELIEALAISSISDNTAVKAWPAGLALLGKRSGGSTSSKREITSINVRRRALPMKRYPPPTPRTDCTMPTRASSANTLAKWCDDTAYFCAISAAEIWRCGSAANSSRLYSARRVLCCNFMAIQTMFFVNYSGIKIKFQRDKRANHHALAAKEGKNQGVVSRQHGTHLVDTDAPEVITDGLEQFAGYTGQTRVWPHVNRKHPATGRRAELPVAHLANCKANHFGATQCDQKMLASGHRVGIASVKRIPISAFFNARHQRVNGDHGGEFVRSHWSNTQVPGNRLWRRLRHRSFGLSDAAFKWRTGGGNFAHL